MVSDHLCVHRAHLALRNEPAFRRCLRRSFAWTLAKLLFERAVFPTAFGGGDSGSDGWRARKRGVAPRTRHCGESRFGCRASRKKSAPRNRKFLPRLRRALGSFECLSDRHSDLLPPSGVAGDATDSEAAS